jgi:hypothetical protein
VNDSGNHGSYLHDEHQSYDEGMDKILASVIKRYHDDIKACSNIRNSVKLEKHFTMSTSSAPEGSPPFIPTRYGGCHPATNSDPIRYAFR